MLCCYGFSIAPHGPIAPYHVKKDTIVNPHAMQGKDEDYKDEDNEEEGRSQPQVVFEGDGNTDLCVLCGLGGSLLCCDGCPAAYHMRCIGETAKSIPEGEWLCPECALGGRGVTLILV